MEPYILHSEVQYSNHKAKMSGKDAKGRGRCDKVKGQIRFTHEKANKHLANYYPVKHQLLASYGSQDKAYQTF